MGQKDFFLKNWKKSTFSLFPLKGKPGDGEQKSEAKNRKSTQGTFFLRRAAICRGERPQKRRWKKREIGFFSRIALTFRFVHFRSAFMMAAAAAARQVCGTVLFWPLFGNSFYFPFGEEEKGFS